MSSIFGDSPSISAAIDGSVQALGSGPAVSWTGNIETFPLNPSGLYATFSPGLPTSGVLRVRISHPTHYFDVTSLALTSADMTIAWTAASWESNSVVYDEEFKPHFQIWSDETYLTSFDYTGSLYTESISFEGTLIQAAARNTPVLHMPLAGDLIDTVRGQAMVPSGTTSFTDKSIVMNSASGAFTITNPGHDWRDFTLCAFMRGPSGAGVMDLRVGQTDTSVIVSLSPTANVEITTLKDSSSLITNVDEDTRQTWFHVAVQQNATHVDVYIDQVLAHSRDLDPALDPDPDRVSLRYPVVFNADLASELAHVTIYPYALDTTDRLAHAESWSGYVPPPALVLHLPLSADHTAVVGTTPAVLPPGSGSFAGGYLTMDTVYSFETPSDTFSATNGFTMCAWMRSAAGWQPGDYVRFRVFEGNFTTNSKAELDLESGHVWSRHEQVTGLSAGQWYHLAWRWRPNDNLQELLVDGVVSASSIQPGQFTTYQSWRVQNNAADAALMHLQVWDGYVDDIAQVMIDYPLPEAISPFASWPMTANLTDDVGSYAFTVSTGTATHTNGYADLSSGLVMTAPVPTQTMTAFGFSGWVYVDDIQGSLKFEWRNTGSKVVHFYIYRNGVGNTAFGFDITGQSGNLYDRVDVLPLNTWYHIAWSYTVGGNLEAWLNKVSLGAEAMSATAVGDINEIYVSTPPSGGPFKCAAVRFYTDGALTQAEVDSDYDLFTPPP